MSSPQDPAPDVLVGDQRLEHLIGLNETLRKVGFTRDGIVATLLRENQARCTPPILEELVRAIVMGAPCSGNATASEGITEPPRPLMRDFPPAEEFPVDSLGVALSRAVEAIRSMTQAPVAICAQAVLAASGLVAQPHADVLLPTGALRPISLFLLTIAATGERKSAADGLALLPVVRWEKELASKNGRERQRWEDRREVRRRERQQILRGSGSQAEKESKLEAMGPDPEAPLEPMLTCPEPTYEGLVRAFLVGQPSMGLFSAEGGQFIAGHAMNADNRLKTAAGLSTIWDGDPIKRVRVGDGTMVLYGRRLSIHLLMQPGVALDLLGDPALADQGFLSRILVAAPESQAGKRKWKDPQQEDRLVLEAFHERIYAILTRPLPLAEGRANELQPRVLPLSPQAAEIWKAFYNELEPQMAAGGRYERIRGLVNKLPEHAARIAAVLTLVENIDAEQIDVHMQGGVEIARYYASEALRLFEAAQVRQKLNHAEQLLHWLQFTWKESHVSVVDCYQRGPNAIREMQVASALIAILEDHGWVRRALPRVVNGQMRRDVWQIRESDGSWRQHQPGC